jgi:RNA polymerase sigma-70 factor (ECF subfamily)
MIAPWQHNPEELASNNEIRQLIDAALDELDEKYRLVFLLRDVQGLSTEEAAEALGLSNSNVKVRLLRARLMLREKLTSALADPATAMKHEHH